VAYGGFRDPKNAGDKAKSCPIMNLAENIHSIFCCNLKIKKPPHVAVASVKITALTNQSSII
jgi:hypothetical protein